jgi:hypothetical protein
MNATEYGVAQPVENGRCNQGTAGSFRYGLS